MTNSIAEYYLDEIQGWKDSIDFHTRQIEELQEWLRGLMQLNTIPKLAALVEHYLNLLLLCKQNLLNMQTKIDELDVKLHNDQVPLKNELVSEDVRIQQTEIRSNIQALEKEYLKLKHDVNEFLADTIFRQSMHKTGNDIT